MNNMNQMMGNMNMNQGGMSSTFMTNFAMDNTAMKIKAIIDPYEKKIIDLEKIIRQKDFEILVLKEKLNTYKNTQMNINNNQMGMGMNNNQMGICMNNNQMGMGMNNNQMGMGMNNNQMGMGMNNNQMGMGMNMGNNMNMNMNMDMMNQNIMNNQMPQINPMLMNDQPMWMWIYNNLNENQNFNNPNNSSNKIDIIFEYKDINSNILVLCDYNEKIKEVVKRFFDKAGIEPKYYNNFKFIFNCKNLCMDLSISENGMTSGSRVIVIKTNNIIPRIDFNTSLMQNKENNVDEVGSKIRIIFKTTYGAITNIIFDANDSVSNLLKTYLKRISRPELISSLMEGGNKIAFLYNANRLKINDTTKVKDIFKNDSNPKITVNDVSNMIGA